MHTAKKHTMHTSTPQIGEGDIASISDDDAIYTYTVVSSRKQRCQCNDRIKCDACRRDWVSRRVKTRMQWLMRNLPADAVPLVIGLTIPPAPDYASGIGICWDAWRQIGAVRSRERSRRNGELGRIYKGYAAAHYLNGEGQWGPHLHGLIQVESGFNHHALGEAWHAITSGRAYISLAETPIGATQYAIGGKVPSDEDGRKRLAELVRGEHQIRPIGR